jgi:hypothetical protein
VPYPKLENSKEPSRTVGKSGKTGIATFYVLHTLPGGIIYLPQASRHTCR